MLLAYEQSRAGSSIGYFKQLCVRGLQGEQHAKYDEKYQRAYQKRMARVLLVESTCAESARWGLLITAVTSKSPTLDMELITPAQEIETLASSLLCCCFTSARLRVVHDRYGKKRFTARQFAPTTPTPYRWHATARLKKLPKRWLFMQPGCQLHQRAGAGSRWRV